MTVLEGIQLTTEYLEKKGIESARINAELMLAHILKCKRLDLYLSFDKPLKDEEIKLYRDFLKRRSSNEPLQYIIGNVEFYGLEFKVNKSVLIPRQETEILIENIINHFPEENDLSFLEVGTGSGNIAVCLAKYFSNASIISIDVNEQAVQLAIENAGLNNVSEKINFLVEDIEKYNPQNKFDVIISNPPYVSSEEYKKLQPEIINHEPEEAVTDFDDGLKFYKLICKKAKFILKNPGFIFFELGTGQSDDVREIMSLNNLKNIIIKKDYLNIERVIYGEIN